MKKFMEKLQSDSLTVILFAVVSFLLGMVLGFLISPIKKGLSIGNNNTSIGSGIACKAPMIEDEDDEDYDWDDDYDEDEVVEF